MSTTRQTGIVVSTTITACGITWNHAEGTVVSTPITASGRSLNHSEGLVAA